MKLPSNMIKEQNRKNIIIAFVAFWVLLVIIAIIFFITTRGKVLVEVKYAPFAATVKLDETTIMNNNNNYITPGEYNITVEFKDFKSYEGTITIDENTKYIFGNLIPANENGEEYMNEHATDYLEVERITNKVSTENGIKQREQYPIINKLPIKDPYYTIGYSISDDGILSITVKSSIAYRQLVTNKILEITDDSDLEKYDILFYDLDNPFSGKFVENDETDPKNYLKNGFSTTGLDFIMGNGAYDNEYYYTFLRYTINNLPIVFRVILRKTNGKWELLGDPYPLLTTFRAPNVPIDVINKVNML